MKDLRQKQTVIRPWIVEICLCQELIASEIG